MHIVGTKAHPTTLRSVEARGSDGDTLTHRIFEEVEELLAGIDKVGSGQLIVPRRMLHKCLLQRQVADLVTTLIIREQAIEAERCAREDHLANLDILLDSTRSTEAHKVQTAEVLLYLTSLEVDICQGIELRNGDVDITDADTRRHHCHTLALVLTRNGEELAIGDFALLLVEILRNHSHTARVAHQDNRIGKMLRLKMQVENRAICIDNQLRRGYRSHILKQIICNIILIFA